MIQTWIPRQSCTSTIQVSDFRHKMEKAIKSLNLLGFKTEAKTLEAQSQHSIAQIEARQQFKLTLDNSDDYPRQPAPTLSTRVRELRDAIAKGNSLIEAVKKASQVLTPQEINARIQAIENYQNRLREVEKQQQKLLGDLFGLSFENEQSLHEALTKAKRLSDIFSGTADETEVAEIIIQLEKILADVGRWEKGDISSERLEELLNQQIQQQITELNSFFEAEEIDSAWDISAIYEALKLERINAAKKRSADWVALRIRPSEQIRLMDISDCLTFERELVAIPGYLSNPDRVQVENYLNAVQKQHAELNENLRRSKLKTWQQQFLNLTSCQNLSKYETEQLLKVLHNPPVELTMEEQNSLHPIELKLISHLDQISLDEILARIEKLSVEMQQQLLTVLKERLI